MSIIKRTTKKGTPYYEVRWTDNGEKKGKTFSRKIDADQYERRILQELEQRALHDGWNQRFKEVAALWIRRQQQSDLSSSYIKRVDGIIRNQLNPAFEDVYVKDITPPLVEKWVGDLLDAGMTKANANEHIKVLKAVINYHVSLGRIPYNPIGKFQLLRKKMVEFIIWDREQAAKFLRLMKEKYSENNKWVYRVYVLALNTGMRAGELWGLRWSDVLWKDRLIKIEQTCDVLTRTLKIGTKSKKVRFVPLTDAVKEVLEEERKERKDLSCNLVFPCGSRPVMHDNFRRDHWEKDLVLAEDNVGVKPIRFHDLRHTAATLLLQAGLEVTEVQQILGHASVTTTMRYVHLIGNRSAAKAAKIFNVTEEISEENVSEISERARRVPT